MLSRLETFWPETFWHLLSFLETLWLETFLAGDFLAGDILAHNVTFKLPETFWPETFFGMDSATDATVLQNPFLTFPDRQVTDECGGHKYRRTKIVI